MLCGGISRFSITSSRCQLHPKATRCSNSYSEHWTGVLPGQEIWPNLLFLLTIFFIDSLIVNSSEWSIQNMNWMCMCLDAIWILAKWITIFPKMFCFRVPLLPAINYGTNIVAIPNSRWISTCPKEWKNCLHSQQTSFRQIRHCSEWRICYHWPPRNWRYLHTI